MSHSERQSFPTEALPYSATQQIEPEEREHLRPLHLQTAVAALNRDRHYIADFLLFLRQYNAAAKLKNA